MTKVAIRSKQLRRVAQWAKELRAKELLVHVSKGELCFQAPETKATITIEPKEAE